MNNGEDWPHHHLHLLLQKCKQHRSEIPQFTEEELVFLAIHGLDFFCDKTDHESVACLAFQKLLEMDSQHCFHIQCQLALKYKNLMQYCTLAESSPAIGQLKLILRLGMPRFTEDQNKEFLKLCLEHNLKSLSHLEIFLKNIEASDPTLYQLAVQPPTGNGHALVALACIDKEQAIPLINLFAQGKMCSGEDSPESQKTRSSSSSFAASPDCIDTLANELWTAIFSFLDGLSLTMLSMVCRSWNDLVNNNNKLWHKAYFMERISFLGPTKSVKILLSDKEQSERNDYRKKWKIFYRRKVDAINFEKLNMITFALEASAKLSRVDIFSQDTLSHINRTLLRHDYADNHRIAPTISDYFSLLVNYYCLELERDQKIQEQKRKASKARLNSGNTNSSLLRDLEKLLWDALDCSRAKETRLSVSILYKLLAAKTGQAELFDDMLIYIWAKHRISSGSLLQQIARRRGNCFLKLVVYDTSPISNFSSEDYRDLFDYLCEMIDKEQQFERESYFHKCKECEETIASQAENAREILRVLIETGDWIKINFVSYAMEKRHPAFVYPLLKKIKELHLSEEFNSLYQETLLALCSCVTEEFIMENVEPLVSANPAAVNLVMEFLMERRKGGGLPGPGDGGELNGKREKEERCSVS